jgi:hypothetical protein
VLDLRRRLSRRFSLIFQHREDQSESDDAAAEDARHGNVVDRHHRAPDEAPHDQNE